MSDLNYINRVHSFIQTIDQLVLWLNLNHDTPIPSPEKKRLITIFEKIKDCKEISDETWKRLRKESGKGKSSSYSGYVICEQCGSKLNHKNVGKHMRKCRGSATIANDSSPRLKRSSLDSTKNPKPKKDQRKKGCSTGDIENAKPKNDPRVDIKENRRLDGSRDYWKLRDHGRFGSHSSYDDMNDESNS